MIPFALPDIGEEEIGEVVDTLRSGWLTTGPKAKRFEQDFAAFLGGDVTALAVNSATAGLHLAAEALGIGSGDEVITTPYTFTATAEILEYLGARPVLVDVEPTTLNIDASRIEAAMTHRTKAILPVHFGGLACDMRAIAEIASRRGVRVIEDAAHAFPATAGGNLVGTLESDVTVFSFYATKTITTGEGGMLVTRNQQVAARAHVMRLHGIDRDVFDRYNSSKPAWYYDVIAAGFKYNMTDVAASIGIHQLKKATRFRSRRQEIGEFFDRELADLPLRLPAHAPANETHAWHLYVIRLDDDADIDRARFVEELAKRGVGTSVHFIPLPLHKHWRDKYKLKAGDFPNAIGAYERAVSLPIYSRMTNGESERVVAAVRDVLK